MPMSLSHFVMCSTPRRPWQYLKATSWMTCKRQRGRWRTWGHLEGSMFTLQSFWQVRRWEADTILWFCILYIFLWLAPATWDRRHTGPITGLNLIFFSGLCLGLEQLTWLSKSVIVSCCEDGFSIVRSASPLHVSLTLSELISDTWWGSINTSQSEIKSEKKKTKITTIYTQSLAGQD